MSNKNARIIIPAAIGFWLIGAFVFKAGTPPVIEAGFVVAFLLIVPVMVFYLMADQGWSTLARRYRSMTSYQGAWQSCPTGQMALISVDDPNFSRHRLRLVGTLRVGKTSEALYLSMLFSKIPLLGRFFSDVQIPWTAVTTARTYNAPGWIAQARDPGALLQLSYDPNYTGTFVEMQIGQPPVFLQLPLAILGDAAPRIGISA
jgi:hypothetical protein